MGQGTDEIRKHITTTLMSGRRSMHFANCQEYLQVQYFIGAITSKTFASRNLGSTDARADSVLANEIEFSVSAKSGWPTAKILNRAPAASTMSSMRKTQTGAISAVQIFTAG